LDFQLEFEGDVDLQANMLKVFGFPFLRTLFGGGSDNGDFANLDVGVESSAAASFEAAAELQASASVRLESFAYVSNPIDDWSENFVRMVVYKRKQIKKVNGVVKCCNCDRSITNVPTTFESVQTGYLALHIKKYPDLDLEQISAEEFVTLYLSGAILEFSENPPRGFSDTMNCFESLCLAFWTLLGF
jgi:hypothetical protein